MGYKGTKCPADGKVCMWDVKYCEGCIRNKPSKKVSEKEVSDVEYGEHNFGEPV